MYECLIEVSVRFSEARIGAQLRVCHGAMKHVRLLYMRCLSLLMHFIITRSIIAVMARLKLRMGADNTDDCNGIGKRLSLVHVLSITADYLQNHIVRPAKKSVNRSFHKKINAMMDGSV